MRPAVAIGASLDGERVAQEVPWRVTVTYGTVVLDCDWPAGSSALRGAVVAAIGPGAHVDFHGHLSDEETRPTRATVCYRVTNDRPRVYAYGPRALDHLQTIARLPALRLPAGDLVPVDEATITTSAMEAGIDKDRWHTYEIHRFYPARVTLARRPRGAMSSARAAWAGQALSSGIRLLLEGLGVAAIEHRPVHVQVEAYRDERVRWRNGITESGFRAVFTTNAILPDGIAIGRHGAEGFGEVRRCATP